MTRRGTASLAGSPVLVGAVTLLVSVIAVFIAYQANQGLPFVPTYDVKAEVPNAQKLVRGNEVRAGGFRVGLVKEFSSTRRVVNGEERAVAVLHMKLDKTVEPLATDTQVAIRPRSALGLKYVELTPGSSRRKFDAGATIPLRNARLKSGEVEDYTALFDRETRPSMQAAVTGFGDALAGRGPSINEAIEQLAPLFRRLTPVMRNLSDPETELAGLFPRLGRFVGELAPVASVQAEFFANQATTFAAISRDPQALQDTISEGPPTLSTSIRSLRVQTPFLARFADVSRRLRPGARELRASLPPINRALRVGTPVLLRVPELGEDLEQLSAALEDLGENPNTLLALRDLRQALTLLRPTLEVAAPYQTVCNYFVYFWVPTGAHLSQTVRGPDGRALGTSQRIMSILGSRTDNGLGTSASSRPVDVPPGTDPQSSSAGPALHAQTPVAVDRQGNADCQNGQWGYIDRLATSDRYGPNELGGAHIVVDPETPGLVGGTWVSRRLGIDSTRDVP
jgi:phospholipid/cholesterol/gamma-HCH transport system substrate-binding protein